MALDETAIRHCVLTELARQGSKFVPVGISARHVHLTARDIEKMCIRDRLYNGNVVEVRTPAAAKKLGIQIVYQEVDMALIPSLSVAENVMFNETVMNMKGKLFMNYGKIRKDARDCLLYTSTCPCSWAMWATV